MAVELPASPAPSRVGQGAADALGVEHIILLSVNSITSIDHPRENFTRNGLLAPTTGIVRSEVEVRIEMDANPHAWVAPIISRRYRP